MLKNNLASKVKEAINIVDLISEFISLKKKGKNYIGLCAFHEDSNPSMVVSDEKQIFNCFSCNVGGDAISFLSKYKKTSYKNSTETLAAKLNIEFKSSKVFKTYEPISQKNIDIMNSATLYFQNELYSTNGAQALKYLKDRKIDNKFIYSHKIGFSNDNIIKYLSSKFDMSEIISAGLVNSRQKSFFQNRLVFPIENIHGDVVGFSARTLTEDESKYINSPETSVFSKSKILYNFYNSRESIYENNEIIITEGFFDVIALESVNIKNVVSIMGTALTTNHLKLLKNLKITLMLDSDAAGINSMKKSILLLLKNKNSVNIVINKENLDPTEYLEKFGKIKLLELLKNKEDGFLFLVKWFKNNQNINDPNTLNEILIKLSRIIPHKNEVIFNIYKNKIAEIFNVSIQILNDAMSTVVPNNYYEQKSEKAPTSTPKSINYGSILMWCLMNNDEFAKLYLKSNPLIVDDNGMKYKQIAQLKLLNDNKIKEIREKFLKKYNDFDNSKKYNKNEFFDIIVKLSIQSLEILSNKLLNQLKNIDNNNIDEIKSLTSRWRTVNKKINLIKKESKNGEN